MTQAESMAALFARYRKECSAFNRLPSLPILSLTGSQTTRFAALSSAFVARRSTPRRTPSRRSSSSSMNSPTTGPRGISSSRFSSRCGPTSKEDGMTVLWFDVRLWLANRLLDLATAILPEDMRAERERLRRLR